MLSVLIYLFASRLWASTLEDHYLQAMAKARARPEIARLRGDYERLKLAQTACRIELREKSPPLDCYEALALEYADRKGAAGEKFARERRLDRLCARSAAKAPADFDIPSAVSASCAKSLAEARRIQKYRDEDDDWSAY